MVSSPMTPTSSPHPEVLGHGEGDPRTSTIKAQSGPNLKTSSSPSPQSTAHKPGARSSMGVADELVALLAVFCDDLVIYMSIWRQQPPPPGRSPCTTLFILSNHPRWQALCLWCPMSMKQLLLSWQLLTLQLSPASPLQPCLPGATMFADPEVDAMYVHYT